MWLYQLMLIYDGILKEYVFSGTSPLWLLTAAMGFLYILVMRSMITANRHYPPSLVWMLANVALVVPVALAPMLLRERWHHATDWLIIAAFAVLLWTSWKGMGADKSILKANAAGIGGAPALVSVFLGNGLLMLGYKLKGVFWPDVGTAQFALLIFSIGFYVELLIGFRRGIVLDIKPVEWKWGLSVGTAAAAANLSLIGSMRLPAVVVFPLVQGIGMGFGLLLLFIIYRECLNCWKIAGVALAVFILILSFAR